MNKYTDALKDWDGDAGISRKTQETIREALVIAERLESGEVSEAMENAVSEAWYSNSIIDNESIKLCIKTMAKVMIEEVENDALG